MAFTRGIRLNPLRIKQDVFIQGFPLQDSCVFPKQTCFIGFKLCGLSMPPGNRIKWSLHQPSYKNQGFKRPKPPIQTTNYKGYLRIHATFWAGALSLKLALGSSRASQKKHTGKSKSFDIRCHLNIGVPSANKKKIDLGQPGLLSATYMGPPKSGGAHGNGVAAVILPLCTMTVPNEKPIIEPLWQSVFGWDCGCESHIFIQVTCVIWMWLAFFTASWLPRTINLHGLCCQPSTKHG